MDAKGETGEDENWCDWIRVETEVVFFIDERGGGGGRLWRARYWEEEEEVSGRLSDTRGGWMVVGRLRRGGGEGRGCRWRGFGTGLRWGVRETWRPIAICSMVGRESR
jgi:hypothetical protein